ncbi:MAG: saccharopine dehydrogenase family protein [Candidatus Geothermincolia bacterium]
MRVIALGGAGDMCSFAVRDLARQADVTEIMIADYDLDKASMLAKELGARCKSMKLDANKESELVRAVQGYDVAVSGIGPFYKYEHKVAAGVLDAGVNYVSICDDYDAAEAVFKLDAKAKKKGVTILTGLGWTPGISNVLARIGADRLDDVEEIAVAWGGSASDSEGYAVILHTIHIFTGFVPSFQHGRKKMVQSGGDREKVRFPEPVGEIYVYNLGHPEPVTIPRFINVKNVTLKGGLSEEELNQVARYMARARLTSTDRRKDIMGRTVKALGPVLFKLGKPDNPCSAIRVDVTGTNGGEWTHLTYGAADHMNALTGFPLSIGAMMVGRGLIAEPGVQSPESCVDPALFLAELGKRDVRIYEGEDFGKQIN